jgi:hypothetical protein
LLGARITLWSLAAVRPEEKLPRWSGCGVRPIVNNEKVGVGPKPLVVVDIGCDVFLQMNEAVYGVV